MNLKWFSSLWALSMYSRISDHESRPPSRVSPTVPYDSDESDYDTSETSSDLELFNRWRLPAPSQLANTRPPRLGTYHHSLVCKFYFIMASLLFSIFVLVFFIARDTIAVSSSTSGTSGNRSSTEDAQLATYQINLDSSDRYHLFWSVDSQDESVLFELRLNTKTHTDWFALGFSERGDTRNADFCLLWFDRRGQMHFEDIKTDNESIAIVEPTSTDCSFVKAKRHSRTLRLAFRRPWDTCDPHDYVIDSGTTHLVFATGTGPLPRSDGLRLDAHEHGFQRIQLLKAENIEPEKLSRSVKIFEATNRNITVPKQETTYWCNLFRLPEEFKSRIHVVQYEAIITPGNEHLAHHMELFHCEVNSTLDLSPYEGECSKIPPELKPCKRVTAAWAYGAGPMIYPKHVGLPVGGENYSLYVMLEIHYNNPDHFEGSIDSSGIRLYYTDELRPVEAGILEIGLEYTDKNSIPPQTRMAVAGHCVAECTRASLPPYGINIFASQLHTHLTGVQTYTQHIRGGIELSEVNRDNHYSPHYQEIRRLPRPVTVFPGDALIHVCVYDTKDRSKMTLGGFGIRDEMCVNYLHYYPKTNLEVCKSSIDTRSLNSYFEKMRTDERQNTSESMGVSDNYYNIQWNPKRAKELYRLYNESPLSMQCNQSSGERFPGYWNGIWPTKVIRHRRKPTRRCKVTMTRDDDNSGGDFGQELTNQFGESEDSVWNLRENSPVSKLDSETGSEQEIELVLADSENSQRVRRRRLVTPDNENNSSSSIHTNNSQNVAN